MMEVPTRLPIKWDEVGLAFATLLYATFLAPVGIIVAVNGVVCHGARAVGHPLHDSMRVWDVGWNCVLVVYVNLHACAQPLAGAITLFSVLAWRLNQRIERRHLKSTLHFCAVQLPFFVAYAHYTLSCRWPA